MTIQEMLTQAKHSLCNKGILPRQVEEVIGDALGLRRVELYEQRTRLLTEEEKKRCCSFLDRKGEGEPAQYLRGYVEFLSCIIHVNRDVLIPRQETEILVANIVQTLKKEDCRNKALWDVCCGSGCMGIAIKKAVPELRVILSDVSSKALAVAQSNAADNDVEVALVQGDLLHPFRGEATDFFVCNPPYVAKNEEEQLPIEVRQFEPPLALFADNQGLEFYERLGRELIDHMSPGGKAWMEIGYRQGEAVRACFSSPLWKSSRVEKDWSGHDRFFFLEIE
ncbi:MAG: peptide chain release factor N(5)-glutamine methyltransferase [Waddliaceae bacterium]